MYAASLTELSVNVSSTHPDYVNLSAAAHRATQVGLITHAHMGLLQLRYEHDSSTIRALRENQW